ncbi:hypothetical protein JHK87_031366 [Glycine soja]|nr:hypothetical protein JHK87_031366 [Glycine soja]
MDGHMGLANSVALMLVGITNLIDDPEGGIVMRTAVGDHSADARREALLRASNLALTRGVTTVVDMGRYFPGVTADLSWEDFSVQRAKKQFSHLVGTVCQKHRPKMCSSTLSSYSFLTISSTFFKSQFCPPPFPSRVVACHVGSNSNVQKHVATDLKFVLHDALHDSGINTTHAREAREHFCSQIRRFTDIEKGTSICINRCVDLGRTALYIAAEDDSLVSHSSVPLPVDDFITRLDDLSMDYCPHYSPKYDSSPEKFLESIERFLYIHKVLTHRSGSAAMLSLIYSEVLKMLRLWSLLHFDAEIFFPRDALTLPTGYHKQKSKESDQAHIMTSGNLLVEVISDCLLSIHFYFALRKSLGTNVLLPCDLVIMDHELYWLETPSPTRILNDLKHAFWPFQHDHTKTLFLRAATAANCVDRSDFVGESGSQIALAKAAQHRLDRGVWTSVRFGDMRRSLSACERLILLKNDANELRDYSILLYHCGLYEQSLEYLTKYRDLKNSSTQELSSSNSLSSLEEDAVDNLMMRLNLVLMEQGWSRPSYAKNFLGNNSEPW